MLALEVGHVVPAWRLVAGVWGDPPPETATTALQGHVSQLRRVLGADAIVTQAPGYLLAVPPGCVEITIGSPVTFEDSHLISNWLDCSDCRPDTAARAHRGSDR